MCQVQYEILANVILFNLALLLPYYQRGMGAQRQQVTFLRSHSQKMEAPELQLPENKARALNLSALPPPGFITNVKDLGQLPGRGVRGLQLSPGAASSVFEALGKVPPSLLSFPHLSIEGGTR